MIVGEAIAKLTLIVKAEIMEDGMYHSSVESAHWSFAVQAFVIAKGVNYCGVDSNLPQATKLGGIDWSESHV